MTSFDLVQTPYPASRMPVLAPRGVVATSQYLAAQAGLSMLQRGGSAVDAALATAIALTVVEPTSNGIGSDAFAIVWDPATRRLHGLNGSGRAPAATSVEALRAAGVTGDAVPRRGWWPVTVPGTPRAWADLHARFGRLPFESLFEPAIFYAEHGYPVTPRIARTWSTTGKIFLDLADGADGPTYRPWVETFAPTGKTPAAAETWGSPGHAATLRAIARSNADDFYTGRLAEQIDAYARATGGSLRATDLAAHASSWVDPIGGTYRGHEVWEIPPNGQGIAALMAANILDGFDLAAEPRDSVRSYHLQIEAMKLAFVDARRYVADPEKVAVPVEGLLSRAYADQRRALIGERAIAPEAGDPPVGGGTVYLCAADADGMMVSFIQSNYMGFGSGIVVPGTGIALQNRGHCFTLEDGHPNRLEPGKRPYHTIIPGFLTRDGEPVGPFGVMAGFMQAQGHLQVLSRTLDYHLNPQAALDAPRWRYDGQRVVTLEEGTPDSLVEGLRKRGHEVGLEAPGGGFGRGQIIWRLPAGGYLAGSETLRADGGAPGNCAAGY